MSKKSSYSEVAFGIEIVMDTYDCKTSEEIADICTDVLDIKTSVEQVESHLRYKQIQEEAAFFEYTDNYTVAMDEIFNI